MHTQYIILYMHLYHIESVYKTSSLTAHIWQRCRRSQGPSGDQDLLGCGAKGGGGKTLRDVAATPAAWPNLEKGGKRCGQTLEKTKSLSTFMNC